MAQMFSLPMSYVGFEVHLLAKLLSAWWIRAQDLPGYVKPTQVSTQASVVGGKPAHGGLCRSRCRRKSNARLPDQSQSGHPGWWHTRGSDLDFLNDLG